GGGGGGGGAGVAGGRGRVGQGGGGQTGVFRPEGGMLGSVGADGSIAVWDLDGGLGRPLPPAGVEQGHCAAFSPDGRLLAAGRAGGAGAPDGPRGGGGHAPGGPSRAADRAPRA